MSVMSRVYMHVMQRVRAVEPRAAELRAVQLCSVELLAVRLRSVKLQSVELRAVELRAVDHTTQGVLPYTSGVERCGVLRVRVWAFRNTEGVQ